MVVGGVVVVGGAAGVAKRKGTGPQGRQVFSLPGVGLPASLCAGSMNPDW